MTTEQLVAAISKNAPNDATPHRLAALGGNVILAYPRSVRRIGETLLVLGTRGGVKSLWIIDPKPSSAVASQFEGVPHPGTGEFGGWTFFCAPRSHANAEVLRRLFPFTKPVLLGLQNSFGCGDRLGLANPAHLRAVTETKFKPVLAQQSIRELGRTHREAEDVLDAASWAVFQEGYTGGFGADADHSKTPEDIDRYARAGFTMYTLDIGSCVVNEAARLPMDELRARAASIPWDVLRDDLDSLVRRYAARKFVLSPEFVLQPDEESVLRAVVKYGAGIARTVTLAAHLNDAWSSLPHEIELSVDETDVPTTPLEHFLIASELKRLGVSIVSLAPRFIGDFEKGIEYKGDLRAFHAEYLKHQAIAEAVGPYKISIHSGSDKFLIYEAIGSVAKGHVHIKTAGTSWLEALRAIAMVEPALFREILECARANYETDRQSYHVTAQLANLRPTASYLAGELPTLLTDDNARQILHVTFGTVLSANDEQGASRFKDRILHALETDEAVHYDAILKHFRRHLAPLVAMGK